MIGTGRTRLITCHEWVISSPADGSEFAKVLGYMVQRRDDAWQDACNRGGVLITDVGSVYVKASDDTIIVGFEVSKERE